MSDIFISYARSTEAQARQIGNALKALGYNVWRDDELPAHRVYGDVLEERLKAAKAVVVIWSAEAVKSDWVRAEADTAREARKLVQLTIDGSTPPLPFNQIQCADLVGWTGDPAHPGWRKALDSVAALAGGTVHAASPAAAPSPAGVPPLPDKPSIAVLPFTDPSGPAGGDWFADGMVSEIVTALTRFASLFVIASGSSLTFRDAARDFRRIGRELGVRYLLEGSVRRAGSRVRISVSLVEAAEGTTIWSERFDGSMEDVFGHQDTVAAAVAGRIEPSIRAVESRRAFARSPETLGSYELTLQAMHALTRSGPEDIEQMRTLLERAVVLDPANGRAQALLALCWALRAAFDEADAAAESSRRLTAACDAALAVGRDDPEVLAWVAHALYEADTGASLALAQRAVALNPNLAMGWYALGITRAAGGDFVGGDAALDQFKRLDPKAALFGYALTVQAFCRTALGGHAEAVGLAREGLRLNPASAFGEVYLALALEGHGDREGALSALDRIDPHQTSVLRSAIFRTPVIAARLGPLLAAAGRAPDGTAPA